MSSSLDRAVKDFMEAIQESYNKRTNSFDTQGEVIRVDGDTAWVHFPGGVDETPVKLTIDAKAGDKVQVRVGGGQAWLVGNASSPPTDDTTAIQADEKASSAINSANLAKMAADLAEASAAQAVEDAEEASRAAAQAKQTTDEINAYAETAGKTVTQILNDGETAKASAENASEYAARALGNLSTVQNVTEALNWITAHGTMTLTTDTALDPTHVYFVLNDPPTGQTEPHGDYHVGEHYYDVVTEPSVDNISTYYELSIDESLNNYVATHLAVDSEGLWLIPEDNTTAQTSSKKILIAVGGTGHTYEDAGTYIIEKINGVDTIVAKFTADGAQIGQAGESHIDMDYHSLQLIARGETTPYFWISDLRNKDDNYQATITEIFIGDGTTRMFSVSLPVSAEVSATDSSHSSNVASRRFQSYTFNTIPDNGATITIVYKTTSDRVKAYTFGRRGVGTIGAMSVAEGEGNVASGISSHAEGSQTHANGENSHAEGLETYASHASHAEGFRTHANGAYSHAEGYSTYANKTYSHAEGYNAVANGESSHAEGGGTHANEIYSHAEGYGTHANGSRSHAEGSYTSANGENSHAQNLGTIAGYDEQTVIGRYNDNKQNNAFEIGNGSYDNITDTETRSNAFEVDWGGNVNASGEMRDGNGNTLSNKPNSSDVDAALALKADTASLGGLATKNSVANVFSAPTATSGSPAFTTSTYAAQKNVVVASPGADYVPIAVIAVTMTGTGTGVIVSRGFDLDGIARGSDATVKTYWMNTAKTNIAANTGTITVQVMFAKVNLS